MRHTFGGRRQMTGENMDGAAPLKLPNGIDRDKLTEAVRTSGYPLQTVVARELSADFGVTEEWGYVDRASQEHRSLDVFAFKRLSVASERLEPSLTMLIECKRSDMPYVFFAAAIPQVPPGFPYVVGLPHAKYQLHQAARGSIEVQAADFLRCCEFPFAKDPVIAVSACRVERKGKALELSGAAPYNNIALPLASALEHYRNSMRTRSANQPKYYPTSTFCVCVADATLVLAEGTPESPLLSTVEWIRLVRQETLQEDRFWRRAHYVVDVVQRGFLGSYVANHVMPFADQLAKRMTDNQDLVLSGKGQVHDWSSWTWSDIQPVGR